ncbi:FAD-dependent oxidoreductase [Bacillus wiedmannii]|uniref:FAD-dependent oxidoreductase n=1 Tax=Bacillus wiedmannii TaxID=1890302 RepID=UPI0008699970|nr:FAD-dependent oxidoreductase [Bacillus wiedmannii]MBG9856029.1 amino acid oxidase [Bacillus wiedmannii]SCN41691.1 FAD dependent oxidoreductase [Bacillus wiedmannii]
MNVNHIEKSKVLVIGGGVVGLTTALILQNEGHQVKIVTEKLAPEVTSVVAGALWEWPPAVCGNHQDETSIKISKEWSLLSYKIFSELSRCKESGVYMRDVTFFFKNLIESNPKDFEKMNELKQHVQNFRHDVSLIQEKGVNQTMGIKDAYTLLAPMIDTDTYMKWLHEKVVKLNCEIILKKIVGNLEQQEEKLKAEYQVDVIVNCTGLGAIELTDDEMTPLRGALVRIVNDGNHFPKLDEAYCISHDGISKDPGFIFILPRGENTLLLGGLAELNKWDLEVNLVNYQPIEEMYNRCKEFFPPLEKAVINSYEPVRTGLRPFRKQSVCLERVPNSSIIHNYGHGGSGVTFSWGCALQVLEIINGLNIKEKVKNDLVNII